METTYSEKFDPVKIWTWLKNKSFDPTPEELILFENRLKRRSDGDWKFIDGPIEILFYVSKEQNPTYTVYKNGLIHNNFGPAWVNDFETVWYLDGCQLSEKLPFIETNGKICFTTQEYQHKISGKIVERRVVESFGKTSNSWIKLEDGSTLEVDTAEKCFSGKKNIIWSNGDLKKIYKGREIEYYVDDKYIFTSTMDENNQEVVCVNDLRFIIPKDSSICKRGANKQQLGFNNGNDEIFIDLGNNKCVGFLKGGNYHRWDGPAFFDKSYKHWYDRGNLVILEQDNKLITFYKKSAPEIFTYLSPQEIKGTGSNWIEVDFSQGPGARIYSDGSFSFYNTTVHPYCSSLTQDIFNDLLKKSQMDKSKEVVKKTDKIVVEKGALTDCGPTSEIDEVQAGKDRAKHQLSKINDLINISPVDKTDLLFQLVAVFERDKEFHLIVWDPRKLDFGRISYAKNETNLIPPAKIGEIFVGNAIIKIVNDDNYLTPEEINPITTRFHINQESFFNTLSQKKPLVSKESYIPEYGKVFSKVAYNCHYFYSSTLNCCEVDCPACELGLAPEPNLAYKIYDVVNKIFIEYREKYSDPNRFPDEFHYNTRESLDPKPTALLWNTKDDELWNKYSELPYREKMPQIKYSSPDEMHKWLVWNNNANKNLLSERTKALEECKEFDRKVNQKIEIDYSQAPKSGILLTDPFILKRHTSGVNCCQNYMCPACLLDEETESTGSAIVYSPETQKIYCVDLKEDELTFKAGGLWGEIEILLSDLLKLQEVVKKFPISNYQSLIDRLNDQYKLPSVEEVLNSNFICDIRDYNNIPYHLGEDDFNFYILEFHHQKNHYPTYLESPTSCLLENCKLCQANDEPYYDDTVIVFNITKNKLEQLVITEKFSDSLFRDQFNNYTYSYSKENYTIDKTKTTKYNKKIINHLQETYLSAWKEQIKRDKESLISLDQMNQIVAEAKNKILNEIKWAKSLRSEEIKYLEKNLSEVEKYFTISENPHSEETELAAAGYRVAVQQVNKIFLNLLKENKNDTSVINFFKSELGRGLLSFGLGFSLSRMDEEKLQRLGEEFRVEAISSVGNKLIEQLVEEVVKEELRLPTENEVELEEELEEELESVEANAIQS